MQPNNQDFDLELASLADATDRVADEISDAVINRRLRDIAIGVRRLAGRRPAGQWSTACRRSEPIE